MGIKEYKATGKMTGLVLSIIGEVCAIISSLLGMVMMGAMFKQKRSEFSLRFLLLCYNAFKVLLFINAHCLRHGL